MRAIGGIVALVVLLAAGCASQNTYGRLSAAELQRLVPGSTLTGTIAEGGTFEGTYFRDGTVAIETSTDSGTGIWEFEGDTVCLAWSRWRNGERYCIYWARDAEGWASYFPDGRLSTRFTLKK